MPIVSQDCQTDNTLHVKLDGLTDRGKHTMLAREHMTTKGKALVITQIKDGKELYFSARYQTDRLFPNIDPWIECQFYIDDELVYSEDHPRRAYVSVVLNDVITAVANGDTRNGVAYGDDLFENFISFAFVMAISEVDEERRTKKLNNNPTN